MEVRLIGPPEEAVDEEGTEYYSLRLSNGAELRLYGNGISVGGSEYMLTYEDIIHHLTESRLEA